MTWYDLNKVHRVKLVCLNYPWWVTWLFSNHAYIRSEGLKQINSKGEIRFLWEDSK